MECGEVAPVPYVFRISRRPSCSDITCSESTRGAG